jgi:sulfite exporter TauE/SafE
MTESIIIYTNPVTATIWNNLMENPLIMIYILAFGLITIPLIIIGYGLLDKYNMKNKDIKNMIGKIIILISGCIGLYLSFFVLPGIIQ